MASVHRAGDNWRTVWAIKIAGKPKPVQRSRSFSSRREAAEFARVAERLYESRGVVAPEEKTVADQVELFLSWCSVHKRAATTHGYRKKLAYVSRYVGAIPLRRLTAEHLDNAYTALLTSGGAGGRALHPRSVLHAHRAMHRMLTLAVKQGLLPDNPAARATPPEIPHHRAKAPTLEEAGKLLAAAQRDPWAPLLALMLMSGLRRGEALGLRWIDLDLDGGWLNVAQVAEQAGREFRLREAPKTNSSARRIALDPATCDVLRAWRGRLAEMVLRAGIRWQPAAALVFPDLRSGSVVQPYEPDAVTSMAHRLARKAGVSADVAPLHGLRHRHASSLMALPLRLVADRLGHSTVRITADLYQHGSEADARAVADAAGEALGSLIPLPRAHKTE